LAVNLDAKRMREALDCVTAWRLEPAASHACPACGAPGVEIIDASARPYTEWYVLKCRACGLDATINIPMAGPMSGPSAF
jgi:predicted RNA-binding Zn-ribbon protein involved in translation (DUF1610 family)